jgi:hypothetical protein
MPEELKAAIVLFLGLLDEKQRRLYAGLESLKTGWGGDHQIAQLLGVDPGTVARGRRQLLERDVEMERVRRVGGGRKPTEKNARDHRPHRRADEARHGRRSHTQGPHAFQVERKTVLVPRRRTTTRSAPAVMSTA